MFVAVEDPGVARLMADAPDWPTLDELWALAPPVPPDDDEWPDDPQPVAEAPVVGVPGGVDPSGWLALDLDVTTTDPRALSDAQLIDAMVGFGRVAAWAQARQARLVAEFHRRRPGSAARYAPDEIALALSMSRFSATGLLERSRRLVDTLHDTLAAYETGRVDGFKVRVICDTVRYLDDDAAEWVQDQVLETAAYQSVAQLRAALARAVIAADPDGANTRHRRARKDRRVGVGQEQDGMATVWAALAAQDAQQVYGTLTGLARSLGPADPRGMDARRADLLVGLMTGEISIAYPTPDGPTPDGPTPAGSAPARSGRGQGGCRTEPRHAADDHNDGDHPISSCEDRDGDRSDSETGDDQISGGETGDDQAGSDDGGSGEEGSGDEGSGDGGGDDGGGGDEGGGDGGGDDVAVDVAAAHSAAIGSCPVCAAQAWRASRPRLRPVNPAKPLVQVLIGHSTLRGADHAPAELVGYGAISAEQAREIAADAVWRRLVYDDESGALLDHGRRTYRPPAALADHVRARDVHCRSPLCRRRAIDCELDHTVPFPHGPTAEPNLATGCLLHHDEKHAPGWTVLQHPDGRIDWTTPTGHTYTSQVHDYRPLPPPPPPNIPGPIADHTDTQPAPLRQKVRVPRRAADWTSAVDRDVAPF